MPMLVVTLAALLFVPTVRADKRRDVIDWNQYDYTKDASQFMVIG
jgi:hypothetical protein